MNKGKAEGRLPVLNQDYKYRYHHGQCSFFGPIIEWDDMKQLIGHTVRYHPLDVEGQPITYVVLEGQLVQVEFVLDGKDEFVFLILEPTLASNLFYSDFTAPKQSQFRERSFRQNHIYYAQPLELKDESF